MRLTLTRFAYMPNCTLGWLGGWASQLACLSEPWMPDRDGPGGLPGSCVPDGLYKLVPHDTPKHPHVWALVNPALGVYRQPGNIPTGQKWGRSAILIHAGNTVRDTEGCLLVGMRFSFLDGFSVLESRNALDQLRGVLGAGQDHEVEIRPQGTGELHE